MSIINSLKSLFEPNPAKDKKSGGFTLVELLVVIAIIGILATLLLLQLAVARGKARDVKRISDVNQIRTALELYFDDNQAQYPATQDLSLLAPKYIGSNQLPIDPLASDCTPGLYNDTTGTSGGHSCYGYAWNPDPGPSTRFQVWAELEQWAQALGSDADLNTLAGGDWPGTSGGSLVNGGTDAPANCTDTVPDCVYDQGVN